MDTEWDVPLSFGQQRLWLLGQLAPSSSSYLLSARFRLVGPLDIPALDGAIRQAVGRHEVLRTVFTSRRGRPSGVLLDEQPARLRVVDLGGLAEPNREPEWERLSRHETVRPFELTTGPLFRFTLARFDDRHHALILTMHHIVSDAVSFGILLGEVAKAYRALVSGVRPRLAPVEIQYADFAHWQQEWLASAEYAEQLEYWRNQLAGGPPEMPLGGAEEPAGTARTTTAVAEPLDLPPGLTTRLCDFAGSEQTTVFVTLLAGYALSVGHLFGLPEVIIACPVSIRNQPETRSIVGFFVNTLPIRVRLARDLPFRRLVGQVHRTVLAAMDHQDVPFDRIVSALRPARRPARPPYFQVVLNYVADQPDGFELAGLEVTPLAAHPVAARAEFALDVRAERGGRVLHGELLYDPDLQTRDAAGRLLRTLRATLAEAMRSPDLPALTGRL